MNIPPARGKAGASCAAKALQARRAGGERSWAAGGGLGSVKVPAFEPPPLDSTPPGAQASDQCPLTSFSVLLVSNSLRCKRRMSWWGCGRTWEVRYLESGFGILPVFERMASCVLGRLRVLVRGWVGVGGKGGGDWDGQKPK